MGAPILLPLCIESVPCACFLPQAACDCAGALERFVGSADEKCMLVAAVASECERAAQIDWAVELYLYAGQPRAALTLINQQLSNTLQPALTDPAKGASLEHQIGHFSGWLHPALAIYTLKR